MSFRYAYCRYCARTMQVSDFPAEQRRQAKRDGYAICGPCSGQSNADRPMLAIHAKPFLDYISEQK